jgi:hypothetical protein
MTRSGRVGIAAGAAIGVVDLDIRSFFSSVDHELMLKAVARHTDLRWVLLYVERWLTAPLQLAVTPDAAPPNNGASGARVSVLLLDGSTSSSAFSPQPPIRDV